MKFWWTSIALPMDHLVGCWEWDGVASWLAWVCSSGFWDAAGDDAAGPEERGWSVMILVRRGPWILIRNLRWRWMKQLAKEFVLASLLTELWGPLPLMVAMMWQQMKRSHYWMRTLRSLISGLLNQDRRHEFHFAPITSSYTRVPARPASVEWWRALKLPKGPSMGYRSATTTSATREQDRLGKIVHTRLGCSTTSKRGLGERDTAVAAAHPKLNATLRRLMRRRVLSAIGWRNLDRRRRPQGRNLLIWARTSRRWSEIMQGAMSKEHFYQIGPQKTRSGSTSSWRWRGMLALLGREGDREAGAIV